MNDLKEFYEGTDEDVRRELEDAGIDVEACRKSFKEAIENAKAKRFLRILFGEAGYEALKTGKARIVK
jgi:hypothetical protein